MRGILMSNFANFIAFKSSHLKCNRNNSRFGTGISKTSVDLIGYQ